MTDLYPFLLLYSLIVWHFLQVRHPSLEKYEFFSVNSCPFLQWVLALLLAILASIAFLDGSLLYCFSLESMALSGSPLFILLVMISALIPSFLDSTHGIINLPSTIYLWVLSVLICCSCRVAHLQFSGKYPLLLSLLSSECKGLGFSPMSSRKFLKLDAHLSQIVIPLPPYRWYARSLGLLQRLFMSHQVEYKGCLLKPCFINQWRSIKNPYKKGSYITSKCLVMQEGGSLA